MKLTVSAGELARALALLLALAHFALAPLMIALPFAFGLACRELPHSLAALALALHAARCDPALAVGPVCWLELALTVSVIFLRSRYGVARSYSISEGISEP